MVRTGINFVFDPFHAVILTLYIPALYIPALILHVLLWWNSSMYNSSILSLQMGECEENQTSSASMTHPSASQPGIQINVSNPHHLILSTGHTSIGEWCMKRVELFSHN